MAVTGVELQFRITGDNTSAMQAMQQAQAQAQQTADGVNNTLSQVLIGHQLERWGQGLLDFSNSFVNVGADFQQSIQFINRLTSSTADGFDQLQNKAITLARTSIFSAQNIVDGMEQLAREGFNVSQIVDGGMNSMIDASVNMATALGTSIPESANMIGQLERVFADQGLSAGQVADIVTQAVLRSGQGLQQFAGGLQYVAAQADMTNTPLATVATMVSYLESQLIKGRNAGTSLRTMFQNLEAPTGKVADELAALGISTTDANGNFIGIMATIDALHNAYANMSPAAQEAANKILFGSYATSATLELIRGGMPAFDAFAKKEGDVGSAADIAHTKMSNLAGSLHNFTSSLFDVQIVLGESVSGIIKPFIDAANMLIGVFLFLPTPVHAAAAALIIVAGVVASLTGAIILFNAVGGMEMVGASVSAALAMIGGAIDIFVPELWVVIAVLGAAILIFNALGLTLGNVQDKWDTFWRVFHGTVANDTKNWHFGELASTIDAFGNAIKYVFGQSAFTDWLNQTAIAVQDALDLFDRLTKKGVNPLAAALEALGFAFTGSGFAGIGSFLAGLGKDVDTFTKTFDAFRKGGVDPVTASLYALSAVFQSHGLTDLANWFGLVGDAVDAFVQGDYGAALSDFAAGLQQLIDALPSVHDIKSFTIHILHWLVDAGEDLGQKVNKFIDDTAWPLAMKVVKNVYGYGVRAYQWAISAGEDLGQAVGKWIDGTAWPAVLSVYKNVYGYALRFYNWSLSEGDGNQLADAVSHWVEFVLWPRVLSVYKNVYGYSVRLYHWAVSEGDDLAQAVGAWIDTTAWPAVLSVYKNVYDYAVRLYRWAVSAGDDLGGAIFDWLDSSIWPTIRDAGKDLAGFAVRLYDWAVSELHPGVLLTKIDQFIRSLVAGYSLTLDNYKLTVTTPGGANITIDMSAIWADVQAAWDKVNWTPPEPSDATKQKSYNAGYTIGEKIREQFKNGLQDAWAEITGNGAGLSAGNGNSWEQVPEQFIAGLNDGLLQPIQNWGNDFAAATDKVVTQIRNGLWSVAHPDLANKQPWDLRPYDPGNASGPSDPGGATTLPDGTVVMTLPDVGQTGSVAPNSPFVVPPLNTTQFDASVKTLQTSFNTLTTQGGQSLRLLGAQAQLQTAAVVLAFTQMTLHLVSVVNSVKTLLSGLNTTTTVWATEMGIHATSGGNWFRDHLNTGLQSAKTATATTLTQILSNAVTWANDMITRGRMGGIGFASGLSSEHWSVASAAADLFNAAIGNLQGGYNSAFNSGYNIGAGFADGIRSQLGNVADAAIALSNASSSTITTRNVIQSPSRLYRWFGQMIGQGFALGIDDQRPLVASSASRLLAAPNTARIAGGGYAIGANTQHVSITNHVTVPAADFPEWIKTVEFVQSLSRSRQMVKGTP